MKYCEKYAALISAWLDGELNEEETGRLQAHLFTCPGCRAYLADLKAMGRAFPSLEEVEVPEDFTASVMARIRAQTPPEKKRASHTLWRRWGAWACCLALLVLVGGGVWRAELVSRGAQNQIAAADAASLTTDSAEAESGGSESAQAAPEEAAPEEENVQADQTEPAVENKEAREIREEPSQDAKAPAGSGFQTQTSQEEAQTPESARDETSQGGAEAETPASAGQAELQSGAGSVLSWRMSVTVPADGADLLAGFVPQGTDEETGGTVYYLSSEEYAALVTALSQRGVEAEETAGDASGSLVRVVVTP